VNGVGRGEHHPVVGGDTGRRSVQRLEVVGIGGLDHRQRHHPRSHGFQCRGEAAGLGASPGDHDGRGVEWAGGHPREVQGGHRADHHDCRRVELDRTEAAEGGAHLALRGRGPALDHSDQGVGRPAGFQEPACDLRPVGHAHEHHQRAVEPGQRLPVHPGGPAGAHLAGHDGDRRRQASVRHRDPGVGRHRRGRGHPGDDLPGHPGPGEGFGLFSAAPEEEGVTTLQAHHHTTRLSVLSQEGVDLPLTVGAGGPRRDEQRPGWSEPEQRRIDEAVVDDHVGPGQDVSAATGEQTGIARARPHQVDGHRAGPAAGHSDAQPSKERPPRSLSSSTAASRPSTSGSAPRRSVRSSTLPSPLATRAWRTT